jgi:hypothetical protein
VVLWLGAAICVSAAVDHRISMLVSRLCLCPAGGTSAVELIKYLAGLLLLGLEASPLVDLLLRHLPPKRKLKLARLASRHAFSNLCRTVRSSGVIAAHSVKPRSGGDLLPFPCGDPGRSDQTCNISGKLDRIPPCAAAPRPSSRFASAIASAKLVYRKSL